MQNEDMRPTFISPKKTTFCPHNGIEAESFGAVVPLLVIPKIFSNFAQRHFYLTHIKTLLWKGHW